MQPILYINNLFKIISGTDIQILHEKDNLVIVVLSLFILHFLF
jgi:hypothetical protein